MRFEFVVGVMVLIGACREREPARNGGDAPEVRTPEAALAQATPLILEQVLRIGEIDGPEPLRFTRVAGIDEAADGSVFVLDRGSYSVRVFDRSGAFVRSFGGRGAGPGEFGIARTLAVGGDTVIVVDGNRPWMFSVRGEPLSARLGAGSRTAPLPGLIRTPAGWLIGRSEPIRPRRGYAGPYRDTTAIRVVEPRTGTFGEPLVRLPGTETYLLGPELYHIQPFMAPQSQFAIAANGTIFTTHGDDYSIDVFSAAGAHIRRIVADVRRVPVRRADYDREVRLQLDQYRTGGRNDEAGIMARILREDYPSLPHARYRPIVGRLLAAPNGKLLVERLDLDPSPFAWIPPPPPDRDYSVWDLFDAAGRITGRLTIPATARVIPVRLTDSALLATIRDSLDVESVARYRLIPARGR